VSAARRPEPGHFYLAFDPDFNPEECAMRFRLTYEGPLLASTASDTRAKHKHEIRKTLHPQLKRLWEIDPNLKGWNAHSPTILDEETKDFIAVHASPPPMPVSEALATFYHRGNYRFVPLAREAEALIAGVEILFLRPDVPGSVIRSGDIDNRLKTLFDALRMPAGAHEMGGYDSPDVGEMPFFVLLEDDKLLSHVSVETDTLLQPTPTANGQFLANDARLIITVNLRPYHVRLRNLHFA
jgi:hypothetical protein